MVGWLLAGGFAGIFADRVSIYKTMKTKNDDIEKTKANMLILEEWLAMYRSGRRVADALDERGIRTVAIYGMGILGGHLYQELKISEISVKYIIDRNPKRGVYNAEVCSPEAKIKNVDAVIVTPVYQFEEIERKIHQVNDVRVVSLRELLDTEAAWDEAGKRENVLNSNLIRERNDSNK